MSATRGHGALLLLAASLAWSAGRAAAQETQALPEGFVPPRSCVTSVADTTVVTSVRILQADGLEAGRYRGEPVTPDVPWTPGQLRDLIPYDAGYAALDARSQELVWISNDLTTWETWAREGPGPGELTAPHSLATSEPGSGDLLVLQRGPPAIHRFGRGGEFIRTFRLDSEAHDIGVTDNGRVWLGHSVWVSSLQSGRAREAPLLTSRTGNGREPRAHWSATSDSLDARRYNVPNLVEVRVAAHGRFVAVYFPWSGIIKLFDDGVYARTLEICMPDGLREAYRRQLREVDGGIPSPGTIQTIHMVELLADVRIGDDGEVWALAGAPTEEGYLHIDRFDASGRNAGSILFVSEGPTFPNELRFGLDPERTVIEFYPFEGHVAVYELSGNR